MTLLLSVFVLAGSLILSSLVTAQELDVPSAAAPVLDGEIGEEEWKGGVVRPLGGGGEARFQRDEDRLYVAIRGRGEGWSHVYLGDEDEIRVLHASAALGDAVYRRSSEDRWAPVTEFAWEMRETSMTSEAIAAREAYMAQHGWIATTSGMGDPAEHEFAIDLDAIPAAARIAVLHATDPSETIAWPSTEDAVQDPGLVRGSTPSELVFEPSSWAKILNVSEDAQEAVWPAPRASHSMVWHDPSRTVVVYGGVFEGPDRRRLWGWDGDRWRVLDAAGPPPLAHFGLAFDETRGRLVLHGGLSGNRREPDRYGATWEWDGATWTESASDGPGVRDHHALAWDPARGSVLLFGGGRTIRSPSGETRTLLADTWSWDGERWKRHDVPGPPARSTHRMVWDENRRVVVLFGGWGEKGLLADTWEWDGEAWRLRDADPAPSARFATRLAYDAARGEVVLYGGRGDAGDLDDTWTWDGSGWMRREVPGPGPRNVHEMAYDPLRERVVLFGGLHASELFMDVWEWDGREWRSRDTR